MCLFYFVYFCVICINNVAAQEAAGTNSTNVALNEKEMINYLTDPLRYDKYARPMANQKVVVYIHVHVYSLESIDAQNLRYTAQVLMRYRWNDPRIKVTSYVKFEGGQIFDRIWSPSIYITNEQDSRVLGASRRNMLTSFWPDGTVVQLSRMKVTLGCSMNFQKFPFDVQECPMIMESWNYNASKLELMWEQNSPVTSDQNLHVAEYWLDDISISSSIARYDQQTSNNLEQRIDTLYGKSAKNFSTVTVHFKVQRQYGFYIMDFYMPSVLIVAVSWVSFWLDAKAVPGRTTLGTATLLTFITLSRNIGNSLPKVSYVKATEIWFIGCTMFIFGSLVEFAFSNIISRRKKGIELEKVSGKHILQCALTPQLYHRHLHLHHGDTIVSHTDTSQTRYIKATQRGNNKTDSLSLESLDTNNSQMNDPQQNSSTTCLKPGESKEELSEGLFRMTPDDMSNWIDRKSRVYFPIAFLVFNLTYWIWTLVLFRH